MDPFFALSLDPFCITTLDGHFQRVNPSFVAALGHPEADLLSTNILDLIHPGDRPPAAAAIAGLAHAIPIAGLESRFLCAAGSYAGSYKDLAWSTTPFPAQALAYTVAHDCTRHKLDQEALRQSEARCVCALESTTDAFFAVDPAWRLVRVNRQAESLWTRRREDILGRNLWEVFPQAAGGPFCRQFEEAMRTGAPAHLEELYPHSPCGRWFEVHAYPSPDGLAVYFRDVTARRLAGEKIKRTLQEKEVLLREVHHRVKNNLQVICSMLRLQERNFRDDTLLQALRDCRERVHAMAMLHDQLHRAKDFSNINLGEYIRNLAASLFSSYGVDSAAVELQMDIEDIPVAVDTAIPCGLIVNEIVSNSLRHAFPQGRTGRVSLGLHARPAGGVELTIGDDGRGFLETAHPTETRSLGLWLVDLLADQIGASVERSGSAGAHYRFLFVGQAS
ncbi:MAG TPA: histidine kinase dimerization/phosphoacceptor domain -containing protein [Bryobacteraceae bacterium]|jgi:PAS domain S-box-containing protein|nr:histidine kinase dimerization/phosphoacceptor domain -containing protein [Bryobacteraceae bacterium]